MATEIERKFLVDQSKLTDIVASCKASNNVNYIEQHFLNTDPVVRIRAINDKQAFLTIKGQGLLSRPEFEYEIPISDFYEMKRMPRSSISKNRYNYTFNGKLWEIDEFFGHLKGLWMAEIELSSIDEQFDKPSFILEEVSNNKKYSNVKLSISKIPK